MEAMQNPDIRKKQSISRKVVIVGAGDVGASFAYALLQSGTAESIILLDVRQELATGQALDLAHGLPFVPATLVRAGTPDDYADAEVIVITAGAKQKPGESRLDLLQTLHAGGASKMRSIRIDASGKYLSKAGLCFVG